MNLNNSHQSPVSYLRKAVLLSLTLLSVTPFSRQRVSRMDLHARLNICLLCERSRLLSLHSDAKSFQFILAALCCQSARINKVSYYH